MTSEELALRIRKHGIEMTHISHGSHIGAVLSVSDIVAVLYNDIMKIYPKDPKNPNRDRFILSKGHAGAAVYAALAEKGFFDPKVLKTHYADGSILSGHVSHKGVPGVEVSTGSLGNGIGVGVGMAMAGKLDNKPFKVFVVVGDGECDEGSVWEAAMFGSQHKLNNLCVIVDRNNLQGLGFNKGILDLDDLGQKWKDFGWYVLEVDGNNHEELRSNLEKFPENKPLCIIANTIKGKGVSFMENQLIWHYRDPQGEDYIAAMKELGE